MSEYVYVWEYRVAAARRAAFTVAYGPQGPWVRLFRGQPGYRHTRLLQDLADPERFLTIDCWESRAAYERFLEAHRAEFDAIDAECERLTESERQLGRFEDVAAQA